LILNIDTTTDICSIALSDGTELLSLQETTTNTHAAQITLLIQAALKEAGKKMSDLTAVAVSNGPGSYTSLRIGTSTAKGICYALDIPLIVVDTLQALAKSIYDLRFTIYDSKSIDPQSSATSGNDGVAIVNRQSSIDLIDFVCPMIDARRMEVYTALFDTNGNNIKATEALIVAPNSFDEYFVQGKTIVFVGNGAPKCKEIITNERAIFIERNCSAKWMIHLSYKEFQEKNFADTAYYTPYYFKAPNITTPKLVIG
jgi:tRNA threonylcarbamoyladenosine biosynthesis protein TsaB